tara:strand:+ start:701 stop:889 length:189 start_codon:yes stop_codon:yes gene_type:complete
LIIYKDQLGELEFQGTPNLNVIRAEIIYSIQIGQKVSLIDAKKRIEKSSSRYGKLINNGENL